MVLLVGIFISDCFHSSRDSINNVNLDSTCNTNCGCDNQFQPVCGANNVIYFSPCHAGCQVSSTGEEVCRKENFSTNSGRRVWGKGLFIQVGVTVFNLYSSATFVVKPSFYPVMLVVGFQDKCVRCYIFFFQVFSHSSESDSWIPIATVAHIHQL